MNNDSSDKFLIGLDPSFTRTGICIINLVDREISFYTASCKIGEKQFENVVHAAKSVVTQIENIVLQICATDTYRVVMESPLPMSSMSSALYSLDTLIYHTFEDHIRHTYNPATLRSRIHGHKYDKKDSQTLTEKYLNILAKSGYIIKSEMGTKKKICHDCGEAFLYCHLWLKDSEHPDFQFDNADDIAAFKARMKELKRREKLLMSGKED